MEIYVKKVSYLFATFFLLVFLQAGLFGQEKEDYLIGDKQTLEMIVHVWGEVLKPGEYRVSDKTNVLQLVSKAGGATKFSKLSNVRITRTYSDNFERLNGVLDNLKANGVSGSRIIKVNLDDYLKKDRATPLPILRPGDVVFVARNSLSTWQNIMGFARDLSVIGSVIFIAIRTVNN